MKELILITFLILSLSHIPNTQKKINDLNILMPLVYEPLETDGVI